MKAVTKLITAVLINRFSACTLVARNQLIQIITLTILSSVAKAVARSNCASSVGSFRRFMTSHNEEDFQSCSTHTGLDLDKTVHAAHIDEIHQVPMSVIIRPIPSVLDETKVQSLMESIMVGPHIQRSL